MLLAEAPVWTFWMGVVVFLLIVPVVLGGGDRVPREGRPAEVPASVGRSRS